MHPPRSFFSRVLLVAPWLAVAALVALGYVAQAQDVDRVPVLPTALHNYASPDLPAHFNTPELLAADNTPADNPTTDAGATLGRVLFYDTALSGNGTTSCASCHIQEHGFSDPARLSVGFEGATTDRHSMSLANAVYYERGAMFWDERAGSLEEQVLMPIEDSVEMGLSLDDMEAKLRRIDYYPDLFADAFGDELITRDRVSKALAQFVRSMVSADAPYDEGVGNRFRNFTPEERQGQQLFREHGCASCHETDAQILDQPVNIGLDFGTPDVGAGNGRFKVPSLRNIEVTAPYMHDGRFDTLGEVIEFYNSDVLPHPALDILRIDTEPLNMNQADKDAMAAFLRTLTDDAFLTDERFSDPFIEVPRPTCNGLVVTVELARAEGPTAGDDVILGTDGADVISGLGGNDTICALGGNDTVTGGGGNDTIFGGDGDDTLHGNRGADHLDGGDGDDRIFGYADDDTIFGGPGADRLHGNFGNDTIDAGDGDDRAFGYGDDDVIDMGAGDDLAGGNFGDDILRGGDGNDTLYGSDGDDHVAGGAGDDLLQGNSLDDVISGGSGRDTIDGGIGSDECDGGVDVDTSTRCEVETRFP